jgi:hypothetical protein
VSETIDSSSFGGDYISLVLDEMDNAHVCYIDTDGPYHLTYAHLSGNDWIIKIVDDSDGVGEYCSLKLDGNGSAHFSYYDQPSGDLKYAYLPAYRVYLPLAMRNY